MPVLVVCLCYRPHSPGGTPHRGEHEPASLPNECLNLNANFARIVNRFMHLGVLSASTTGRPDNIIYLYVQTDLRKLFSHAGNIMDWNKTK